MDKTFKKLEVIQSKHNNKLMGYEPKCKVCNDENLDEIHRLHELGCSNRDVMRELSLEGVFSEQALGRHLKKHYPLSKSFHEKQELMNEKVIKKAIEEYKPIADLLLDNDSFYCETFLNDNGYCTLTNDLCYIIPEKKIMYPDEVIEKLKDKYDSSTGVNKDNLLNHILNCYNCRLLNMQSYYNVLFEILFDKVFKKDISLEKDFIPLIVNNDFDKTGILEDLKNLE